MIAENGVCILAWRPMSGHSDTAVEEKDLFAFDMQPHFFQNCRLSVSDQNLNWQFPRSRRHNKYSAIVSCMGIWIGGFRKKWDLYSFFAKFKLIFPPKLPYGFLQSRSHSIAFRRFKTLWKTRVSFSDENLHW